MRAFIEERSPATAERCAALLADMPAQLTIGQLLDGAPGQPGPRPAPAGPGVPAADVQPPPRRSEPALEPLRHRAARRERRSAAELPGQLARHLPELGGARLVASRSSSESMIAMFVNATTADGYNPYRITRDGIDWEVPEPDNPWANIGYWSDHQIVYLLRLLETSARFHPGRLRGPARRARSSPTPTSPTGSPATPRSCADPRDTITFDDGPRARSIERAGRRELGADGQLGPRAGRRAGPGHAWPRSCCSCCSPSWSTSCPTAASG